MSREAVAKQMQEHAEKQMSQDRLTTSNGAPVDSLTASMTAGERGPIVLQDFALIDTLARFDRERIRTFALARPRLRCHR